MTVADAPAAATPSLVRRLADSRAGAFVAGVVRQVVGEPVAQGRLRDDGWPYGLRALVVLAYAMFSAAALIVIVSGAIRAQGRLVISGSLTVGAPAGTVWPLVVLLSFGAAGLLTAAVHGPWWLKVLGLVFGLMIMGGWSLRSPSLTGSTALWLATALGCMVALVVFVVVRGRRSFAWWEFAVFWALVGTAMLAGIMESQFAKRFGFDFNVQLLQQTAQTLGVLALPTAMVAGASVAEVAVRATVSAVQQAQRLSRRWWPAAILGTVLGIRVVQAVRQLTVRDPVSGGWVVAILPAVVLMAAFTILGLLVLRSNRRRGGPLVVSALAEDVGAVGLGVAAALVGTQFPLQVGLAAFQAVTFLFPNSPTASMKYDLSFLRVADDPIRVVVGTVLLVLAARAVRRGRPGRALLLGCIGIMLLALARSLVLGDATAAQIDPDVLNLVATLVVAVVIVVDLVRRRLDGQRLLAYAGVLTLSALFSSRDFISDPLGFALGFSGAALVLFGLTWDLLTGSSWGNGDSRRFPRPTRVLLVLTNSVLTMTVLGYAALIRDGSTTIYLDPYAEFGNLLFGTALLAAAVIAVLDAANRRVPVE